MDTNRAVRNIMTTNLVTVPPTATAKEVKNIFNEYSFHHLPVVDAGERLLGIISKEDFSKIAYVLSLNTSGKTFSQLKYDSLQALDFMTKYPLSLDPEDTIGLAADIFLANKFHALPIVEDDALVGLVTTHDLLLFSFSSPIEPTPMETYEE
ncbi:MAG: CBS domain-containing protein [Saprospiraceae bacterium]